MRKVVYFLFSTLDGLIAGPDGELESVTPATEEHQYTNDVLRTASALMFGRVMYEMVASYWDTVDVSDPSVPPVESDFASIFQRTPRIVFSRTLERVDPKATLIRSDIAGNVARLKNQPGGPLLLGCGPDLLATLANLGLIDEFRIMVNPTILGRGKPMFRGIERRINLELMETKVFPSGGVLLAYKTARTANSTIIDEQSSGKLLGQSAAV